MQELLTSTTIGPWGGGFLVAVGVGMSSVRNAIARSDTSGCDVLVLDNSPIFAEALTQSLAFAGVRTAHGDIARPHDCPLADVVILDADRPIIAIAAARSLRRLGHDPRIVLLVRKASGSPKRIVSDIGAQGWLTRQASIDDVTAAVRQAAAGKSVAPFRGTSRNSPDELAIEQLTDRERVVVQLIATGRGNSAIADSLGISANTVRTHVQNVMAKLGVGSRTAVVAVARRSGVLDVGYAAELSS